MDQLFEYAWRLATRSKSVPGGPRARRLTRSLGADVRDELERRGFDVELSSELEDQIPEIDGHADIWRIFLNPHLLSRAVQAMVAPFSAERITKVVGIESRGFLLGGAVAVALGVGFAAIRKSGRLPGAKLRQPMQAADYRGQVHELMLQASALGRRDRVLLVDDWIESGNQALAVKQLVLRANATFVGTSVIVNQLPTDHAGDFASLRYLVRYFPRDEK